MSSPESDSTGERLASEMATTPTSTSEFGKPPFGSDQDRPHSAFRYAKLSIWVLGRLFTGSMAAIFGIRTGMLIGPLLVIAVGLILLATQRELRALDGRPERS